MNMKQLEKLFGAVKSIGEVLEELIKNQNGVESDSIVPNETAQLKEKKEVSKAKPTVEEETAVEIDEAVVKKMNYNELKALCKELGLDAKGTKKDLLDRILQDVESEEEEEIEKVEAEVVSEPDVEEDDLEDEEELDLDDLLTQFELKDLKEMCKKLKLKLPLKATKDKMIAKLKDVETLVDFLVEEGYIESDDEEVEEDDSEEVVNEDAENPYAEIEEMSDKELKEVLEDLGKSTKGKHQALVAKVIKAIEDGELDFGDEDSEDEEEVETEEEYVYSGSKKRLKAIEDMDQELRASYEAKEIKDKDIKKYLDNIHNGKFDTTDLEDNLEEYIRLNCELIDDDGEVNDLAQAYYVEEDIYCCGDKTKEVDGSMFCEHCGTNWELE